MADRRQSTNTESSESTAPPFGDCHVLAPTSPHTHTMISLHGRGSTSREFAEDLLASPADDGGNLPSKLSGWRWVFPSARMLWSTAFQEDMSSWFEAHSLTDITARQDLQVDGIRDAVRYIRGVVDGEIERLRGDAGKVFLGGISQGGAVGLWTLLAEPRFARALGGFVGASTWLPFAVNIERVLMGERLVDGDGLSRVSEDYDGFVGEMMPSSREKVVSESGSRTPIFLGHGRDDAYVDIGLARQATSVLERCGFTVRFAEYTGAEEEGHWFKVPDEIQDIWGFLIFASHTPFKSRCFSRSSEP